MPRRSDSDDLQLVLAVITARALCVPCIMKKAGVTRARVRAALATLAETLRATHAYTLCDDCLILNEVFETA